MTMLIYALVMLLIFAIVWWAINQLSLPPPVRMVVVVIMAIVAILMLLQFLPISAHPFVLR